MNRMLWICALLCAAGCSSDDGGLDPNDPDFHLYCQGDESPIAAGMAVMGESGTFVFQLVDYAPQPLVVGDNSFHLRVTDTADVAVDATLDLAETWARVHDHGTPVTPLITPRGDSGEFDVDQMNVVHTGSWLFRFEATANGQTDRAEFNFGIDCPPEP